MHRVWTAIALAAACVTAACTSTSAAAPAGGHVTAGNATSRPVALPVPASTRAAPMASAVPAPAPPPAPRVSITRMRMADGSVVTVATFRGPVRYVLHNGSGDPGAAAAGLVRAGPVVTGAERGRLLAAFNGGFKLGAGAGGYEQEGHVISPLERGFASLVIDRSGQARIGVWGHGVPAPGEAVYSVRQNLQPLVYHGRPTLAAADPGLWGATLGGGAYVARSALGQDASGELMYAGSMSAIPADLAEALVRAGARIAMELDINPAWVQLDVAHRPGGPLRAEVPGQNRPADQYLVGWTRDFVTVLAASPGTQAAIGPSRRLLPDLLFPQSAPHPGRHRASLMDFKSPVAGPCTTGRSVSMLFSFSPNERWLSVRRVRLSNHPEYDQQDKGHDHRYGN